MIITLSVVIWLLLAAASMSFMDRDLKRTKETVAEFIPDNTATQALGLMFFLIMVALLWPILLVDDIWIKIKKRRKKG